MKRTELCRKLSQRFTAKKSFGVIKGTDVENRNTWFVIPPPAPTQKPIGKLPIRELAAAHKVLDATPSLEALTTTDQLILKLILRQEAVSSSRMEGTWSTIDEVLTPKDAEKEGRTDQQKSNELSVRSYAGILEKNFNKVQFKKHKIFDMKLIKDLHQSIMSSDTNFHGTPGRLRKNYVFIGGLGRKEHSIYNPPPPHQVPQLIKSMMHWFQDETIVEMGDAGMGLSLPLRIAVGHSHFEGIHPFSDGNGRVGRMLWPLQMIASGKAPLYLSGFIEAYKEDYGTALQASQKKLNYSPIIEFTCAALTQSYKHFKKLQKQLHSFPEEWKQKGNFRKNSAADKTIEILLESPILTAKTLGKKLSVSQPTANKALLQLTTAKILTERTGFSRNRVFAAEDVIKLLTKNIGT